jgi:hypothetical protein
MTIRANGLTNPNDEFSFISWPHCKRKETISAVDGVMGHLSPFVHQESDADIAEVALPRMDDRIQARLQPFPLKRTR